MAEETLLIVDDDRSLVEAVSLFLEGHGYRTVPAFSGEEGLARARRNGVALAIIDLHLPDISGIDVARTLHQEGTDIAFILISGDDRPEIRRECLAAGARSFLSKPLVPDELLHAVSAILDKVS